MPLAARPGRKRHLLPAERPIPKDRGGGLIAIDLDDLRMELVQLTPEEFMEAIKTLRPLDFLRLWPDSCIHRGETFAEMCRRVEHMAMELEEEKLRNYREGQLRRHGKVG